MILIKTVIEYIDSKTGLRSDCGDNFNIEVSSRNLGWNGILVEQGTSSCFFPKEVITTNFYFATELENTYSWEANYYGEPLTVHTDPGDTWINPPFTPFSHDIEEPCKFLIVTIEEDLLYNSFEGYLPTKDLVFLNQYNVRDKNIEYMLKMLFLETINKGQNGEMYLRNLIRLFSNYFIKNYSNYYDVIKNNKNTPSITKENISTINDLVISRMDNAITIDELAKTLNMSKFHFLNEFKKQMGITPYQYIITLKIDEAKRLLHHTQDKILDIGLQLGFSDNSHFTRTFKKFTGKTPIEYRKNGCTRIRVK